MARSLPGTMIDMARGAIASLNGTQAAAIADYVIVSVSRSGDVEMHTSLCCAEHAQWLLSSVQFSNDQCDKGAR